MYYIFKIKKGISLITLVITIVVVIVLTSIVISAISKNNLIDQARLAVNENNKAADLERLNLEQTSYLLDNNGKDATLEDYIDYLDKKGIIDKDENYYPDENDLNVVYITLEDDYVYEIQKTSNGSFEIEFVGKSGNFSPSIKIISTEVSTNDAKVTLKVKRNEGGTLKYYIKEESESDYTLKSESANTTYKFENLIQDKNYSIKVIAKATNGLETEATTTISTGAIHSPIVTFTYLPNDWTNGNVTVTAEATDIPTGMTLYIGEELTNCNTLASTGIIVTENKRVYAVYKDTSNQYGGAAVGEVTKIDKVKPVVNSVDVTTNSVTVHASDQGGSEVSKYALTTENTEPLTNAFQTSNVFSANQSSTYYAWAMDGAGNISETGYSQITATVEQPTVTFTYSPNDWINGNVTVTATADSIPTGMTLYIGESATNCTTLASTGITITENKRVYAVYKDSANQYGGAAVGEVTKIDKVAPNSPTITPVGTKSGDNYTSSVQITITDNGDTVGEIDHIEYSVSGAQTVANTTGTSVTITENGTSTIKAKVYDKALNVSAEASLTVTIYYNYTLTYNLDGGTVASANPSTYTKNTSTFTINNPSKEGYTFSGWTDDNDIALQVESIPYSTAAYGFYGPYWGCSSGYYRVDVYGNNLDKSNNIQAYDYTSGNVTLISSTILSSEHIVIIALANGDSSRFEIFIQNTTGDINVTREEFRKINTSVTIPKGSTGNRLYTANWIPNQYTITFLNVTLFHVIYYNRLE